MELIIDKKPIDECDARRAARWILQLCKDYMSTEEGKAEFEKWQRSRKGDE